jgi:DNA segregation ATPase FtsK/SpoIIIE-like protein
MAVDLLQSCGVTVADADAAMGHLRDRLRDHGKLTGCTSYVQRRMGIGYNHAARILGYLELTRRISEPDQNAARHFRDDAGEP